MNQNIFSQKKIVVQILPESSISGEEKVMHIYFGVNGFAPNTCPVLVICRGVNLLETKGLSVLYRDICNGYLVNN